MNDNILFYSKNKTRFTKNLYVKNMSNITCQIFVYEQTKTFLEVHN